MQAMANEQKLNPCVERQTFLDLPQSINVHKLHKQFSLKSDVFYLTNIVYYI